MNEELPKAFVKWINAWMVEQWLEQKKGVIEIAAEIGVRPALLSRWMGEKDL